MGKDTLLYIHPTKVLLYMYLPIYTHTQNFLSKEKVGNIITIRLEYLIKDDIKSSQLT